MELQSVSIKNFRLLKNVSLSLESDSTVIVGRNNSGKTSLTEFLRILLASKGNFRFEDFSLSVLDEFVWAHELFVRDEDLEDIRNALPEISASLYISYGADESFGALSHFVIDLNEDCNLACVNIKFGLKPGQIDEFFSDTPNTLRVEKDEILLSIKNKVLSLFELTIEAQDPEDENNRKIVSYSNLESIIKIDFIDAQRVLDNGEKPILGKVLEELFQSASKHNTGSSQKDIAEALCAATKDVEININAEFNANLNNLAPIFDKFNYPGLVDPHLQTETELDVSKLLSNHTTIFYKGSNGINLPEKFNGLGSRNLLFMLLKLYEFYQVLSVMQPQPCVHLIIIEEPEAHLHPQMQSIFIRQLTAIRESLSEGNSCSSQYMVTTHSSHLANEAGFSAIRYFLTRGNSASAYSRFTEIRNLRELYELPTSANSEEKRGAKANKEFLHKYLTQTKCDLFFADQAILIEGATERLILPEMIRKLDNNNDGEYALGRGYITTIEVGGAYAQIFFSLLKFLELPSLVITDIDSTNLPSGSTKRKKCKVSDGDGTSNSCLKNWFNKKVSPSQLLVMDSKNKTDANIRLAYQIPHTDSDACGRSFEDAFMLANVELFDITGRSQSERESQAWNEAANADKTDFAIKYSIEETNWVIPRYINEGLEWLAGFCKPTVLNVEEQSEQSEQPEQQLEPVLEVVGEN
ncbi:ATP-dependent nuclease [Photobacterium swingsii]|uniref:ATP-dependent nuclease n=1 Tax=Photobacterium swingsii TaxID=680026 RepID=UPI004067A67B